MNEQTLADLDRPVPQGRLLHTMIRVSNLEQSLTFYLGALGMKKLRTENYLEGRFTLVFIGYGDEASNSTIELTHNWGEESYSHGTGFGHIAIGVVDIYAVCKRLALMGVEIIRAPGPMAFTAEVRSNQEVIAFIKDPDGYTIELIETPYL